MTVKLPLAIFGLVALAACGTKTDNPENPGLRSDMPARTSSYYVNNRAEMAEMEQVCSAWQASQRPIASWPAVVTGNCNSVNAAKVTISKQSEIDKLRKEAGA